MALSANNNRRFNFERALDNKEARWVDSAYAALSPRERIGQLLMIRAHSDRDSAFESEVERQIRQYGVGGLCFFQGTPEKQAALTNRYQAASERLPLMIAMDAEWGLGMRLKNACISFPSQMALGALQDESAIYDMGREIARQCRRLGVHVNFAPVADVNNNPANPVINHRSFGEDLDNVIRKSVRYAAGLQDGGVLACAKHFPGHGDTDKDSHFDLPIIRHDRRRLDSLELKPFRALIQSGIGSVMVAHLHIPTLDDRPNRPSTLSENTIHRLLRRQLDFEGLVFTDAMEMKGVSKFFSAGKAEVEALHAGNDVILLPADIEKTIEAIEKALADGYLDARKTADSVKRVLRAKYRLGLRAPQRVETANLRQELNTPEALLLKRRLIESSLTLARDRDHVVGFRDLGTTRIAVVSLGDTSANAFAQYCGFYAPADIFSAAGELSAEQSQALLDKLRPYDVVIVGLFQNSIKASENYGVPPSHIAWTQTLNRETQVVLVVLGNPYLLGYFDETPTVLAAYSTDTLAQQLAAQALFGAVELRGRLPVTASPAARFGQGLDRTYPQGMRLAYDTPESAGLRSDTLAKIDDIAAEMIASGAAPGCQILVARNNRIVWHKAYGYTDYTGTVPVSLQHLYDLASVTKVTATTVSLMHLRDRQLFHPDSAVGAYLPQLRKKPKGRLPMRQVLAHHAGLQAWIPFYKQTLDKQGQPLRALYSPTPRPGFDVPVARSLYLRNDWRDTLWQQIYRSESGATGKYRYSDLGMLLAMQAVENQSGKSLERYARENFYAPLGMGSTVFAPWRYRWESRCVPSEEDNYFRRERLQGYVHDMAAAMLGGEAGHAGLFGNANDLAKLFQMLLNGGSYFGECFLNEATVQEFTANQYGSRRGLGFDLKETAPGASPNMCVSASPRTFGHLGFTGTCVWADPEQNLIFVFLSNRTYPSMDNNKLITGNYRPRIQEVVYRAIQPEK